MSLKVWSFLVSRNRYLDYRTVVAPDFICEAQISNLLARAADGDLTDEGTAICRKITGSNVGDLTLVFQIVKATKADIKVDEEIAILRDPFGREIYLIQGLVFHEALDNLVITRQAITAVHRKLVKEYGEFWELTDPTPAKPSTAFELNDSIISEEPLILKIVEPFRVKQSLSSSVSWEKLTLKQTLQVESPVSSIAFSPKGKSLISRSDDQTIQQWDLDQLTPHPKTLLKETSYHSFPSTVVFSPDGDFCASGTYLYNRNYVWLWNFQQNQKEKRLYERTLFQSDFKEGTLLTVAFSPDGQILAGGTKNGSLLIWDMLSYKKITLADDLSEVKTIAFTPDGEILISGEEKGIINVWHPKNRLKSQPLATDLAPVNSVSFSPDGIRLAIGYDDTLEIWNFRNRDRISSIKNHNGVNSVAFSPDGQVIAVGSKDGTVSIWDTKKERYIFTNHEHESEVRSVIFSSKNKLLASCSQDKTINIWQY